MLTNLTARVLTAIVKKSRLEMLAEVEEIIERDGESCPQFAAKELGITVQEATSLFRALYKAEGIFKSSARPVNDPANDVQFYTATRPRNTQSSPEVARRDPLVAFLFGEAK